MEQEIREEPRPSNDSRKRAPGEPGITPNVVSRPSFGQRWRDSQPSKTVLFWSCLASVILTIVVGIAWGGWMTASAAETMANTVANDAVVQRLAPICVANFAQDPDKSLKFDELSEMSSYQQAQFVQEQGWATISGAEKPDRKVADACTQLLLEMNP